MSIGNIVNSPEVSVIIPTYNDSKFIIDAIDSILDQTYKNLEIIVVDDGSIDDTKEKIKKFNGKIRYIYQENRGVSAARNRGVKEAEGDYIAFLDADDIWLPMKLELQMDTMLQSVSVGLVSCRAYTIDMNGIIQEQFIRKNYPSRKKLFNDLLIKNIVSGGSNALIKKECFNKVGLFNENLKAAEDWDMWLRIAEWYDIKFVEKPLVKIRIREDSMSAPANTEKMLQNELRVLDKIFSGGSLKRKWFLKRKAYSYRYYSAAIVYKEIEKRKEVTRCILKSFCLFPFAFFNKLHSVLALYAILGNQRFDKLKAIICERKRD